MNIDPRSPLFIIILAILLILPVFISQTSISRAEESGKNQDTKNLTAHIALSHSADFIGSWLAENKHKQLPASEVKKVAIDKPFFAAFLAKGLTGNHADRYQFKVDWKLYKPDGTVLFSEAGYARGSGPVPEKSTFSIAYPTLFIVLDKSDPPGKYRLAVVILDKITRASAIANYSFEFSH